MLPTTPYQVTYSTENHLINGVESQRFICSFASETVASASPIQFALKATFFQNKGSDQSCPVCLEVTSGRSFNMCNQGHAVCADCIPGIFKTAAEQFRVVNAFFQPDVVCVEASALPKCPMRCAISSVFSDVTVSTKNQRGEWTPAQIRRIDHQPGQQVTAFHLNFDVNQNMLFGKLLDDGSIAYFPGVDPARACRFVGSMLCGTIMTKTIENGQVYLKCSSDLTKTYLGKKIEATIKEIETKVPRGYLNENIWINFFGVNASIGDRVSGYVCKEESLYGTCMLLNCTPYQEGDTVEFTINGIDPYANGCGMIYGVLEDGETEVEFIANPATGYSIYQVGQKISAMIRGIDTDVETATCKSGLCLMCSPEDYEIHREWQEDSSSG